MNQHINQNINEDMNQTMCSNMNMNYDNELNKRLENRNVPSGPLQPLYDIRPISTKYTLFHSIDEKLPPTPQYTYDPYKIFNPGDRAPIDYFIKNIDIETKLRSQFFALQKSPQALYVPEINSQLYENPMAYSPEFFSPTDSISRTIPPSDHENLNQPFYNSVRSNSRK
jgi:hypothetical protein